MEISGQAHAPALLAPENFSNVRWHKSYSIWTLHVPCTPIMVCFVSFPVYPLTEKTFLLQLFFRGKQFLFIYLNYSVLGSAPWTQLSGDDAGALYGNASKTLSLSPLSPLSPPTRACQFLRPKSKLWPLVYRNVHLRRNCSFGNSFRNNFFFQKITNMYWFALI